MMTELFVTNSPNAIELLLAYCNYIAMITAAELLLFNHQPLPSKRLRKKLVNQSFENYISSINHLSIY